jgi:hypothetical protein
LAGGSAEPNPFDVTDLLRDGSSGSRQFGAMDYPVTPQDYLARARERLISNDPANLFYAAFELRCCVESRQADYLDALEKYQGVKVKGWKVGEVSRKLLHVWPDPKIARLTYGFDGREFPTYFTPVPPKLVRAVEKDVGPFLHAQLHDRRSDDEWWQEARAKLTQIYKEAWIACRGEHMALHLRERVIGVGIKAEQNVRINKDVQHVVS